ncbi:hypothetical protein KZZ52_59980 [Dactylosporangium sp. AC04546]|uniref:hypothetical protein n=1 Tax=Dactylosporangium sp. AC04546 TaxID=2862460 RepID=UPI001EDDE169|nr:hypothetical protein [Dactylosporangium sp. AC04546]WVK83856.1 hypothetical protein KZZ52_59980 [Dactylosporangium sp. AC04546]
MSRQERGPIRGLLVLLGLGFGQLIVVVQEAAPPHQLGVATTGIRFFQSLGNAVGVAVFGALFNRVHETKNFVDSIDIVFAVAMVIMLLALLFATRLRDQTLTSAVVGGGSAAAVSGSRSL